MLVSVDWGWGRDQSPTSLLRQAKDQLEAYFDGTLKRFDLPLKPAGTEFHRRVWRLMAKIPYGSTRTYGDLAREVGGGARAVGTACGRNPLPIIIPCHRVLAAGGRMGGYSGAGGLDTKGALLTLEGAIAVRLL